MEAATRQILDTDYLKDVFEKAFKLLSVAWLDGEDYKPCVLHINNMVTDDGRARRSSMKVRATMMLLSISWTKCCTLD